MKKTLLIMALVLTIAASIVAGTLAVYTIDLGIIAEGSVVAKEFKLTGAGADNFVYGVKIAPTETKTMTFTVSNFEGAKTSETLMSLDITVDVGAASGKSTIEPLTVVVKKSGTDEVVSTGTITNGVGTLKVADSFGLDKQTKSYDVEINWPSTDNDTAYAGAGFGTQIEVSVVGTQITD